MHSVHLGSELKCLEIPVLNKKTAGLKLASSGMKSSAAAEPNTAYFIELPECMDRYSDGSSEFDAVMAGGIPNKFICDTFIPKGNQSK